ncbi:polyprotein [mupivirus A1]|uniref:Genome polyprotein n=1 Tax=mupivirus A1 TaxID=2847994 RepID=A0A2H4RDT1_9PICO|nr:polyprotein [Picornavirales sp.]ATY47692.1 polyprotein [mupivirus A1]
MELQGLSGEGEVTCHFCLDCETWPCVCFIEDSSEEVKKASEAVQFTLRLHELVSKLNNLVLLDPFDDLMDVEAPMESQGNSSSKGQSQNQSNGNFGTVVNNYYQNTYQGSVDMSGVGVGSKPTSTITGLVDSATSAFKTVAPLLMDQNTEEMTQLSDRVMTESAGNSAINTQSTVGRMVGYGVESDGSQLTSCGDVATKGQPATDRWYTYRLVPWTTSQDCYHYQFANLPYLLTQGEGGGVFAQNLLRHYTLKCGWKVQVQCNASHFHSGALLCFLAPEWPSHKVVKEWHPLYRPSGIHETHDTTTQLRDLPDLAFNTPEQWPVFPHQVLNLRTGTSIDLEVPYVGVTPTADPTQHNPWTLVIAVISPLAYSAGASPEIDITVSVQPVNPVWNGLRQPLTSQGLPTVPRENIGQFTTTLPDHTTPLYGLVKNRPTDYLPGEFTDLISVAKLPCFLSIFEGNTTALPYFSVGNSIPEGPLWSSNVVLSSTDLTNTMVGTMSNYFSQYRGSLNFNFLFTGTAMMKLKLLIAYTPPGAGIATSIDEAMQGTYCIWDIGLNSTWVFSVPFVSVSDWRFTQQGSANDLNSDGWITIWQLTPLTFPPGSPATANIVCYGSAGDDFSFRNPIFIQWMAPQGVDNAEKGETKDQDATEDYAGKRLDVDKSHTDVSFFYDRSRVLGFLFNYRYSSLDVVAPFVFNNAGKFVWGSATQNGGRSYLRTGHKSGLRVMRLCPHPSVGLYQIPFFLPAGNFDRAFWNLAPFTYFRADLEITVVPFDEGPESSALKLGEWKVYWFPCGAPVPRKNQTEAVNFEDWSWGGPEAAGDKAGPIISNLQPGIVNLDPQAVGRGTTPVSFQIPWNSPQTVCSTTYNGYASYSGLPGYYGMAPANFWGWLMISANRPDNDIAFLVYVRYKNMRTWVPRPVPSRPIRQDSRMRYPQLDLPRPTVLRNQVLESQGCFSGKGRKIRGLPLTLHTKDEPIVTFYRDRGVIQAYITNRGEAAVISNIHANHPLFDCHYVARSFHDWINFKLEEIKLESQGVSPSKQSQEEEDEDLQVIQSVCAALDAPGSAETLMEGWEAVKALKKRWAEAKEAVKNPQFWSKVVMAIIKLSVLTYAWFESEKTSVRAALGAFAVLATVEWAGLYDMLIENLQSVLTTPPPKKPIFDVNTCTYKVKKMTSQGPGYQKFKEGLSTANQAFNLAKSVDWLSNKLKEFINWVKGWFEQEEKTPKMQLAELVKNLPEWIVEIHEYREGKRPGVSQETKENIAKTYELAISQGNTGLANFLERFRNVWTHTNARVEPVVIVLKGKPGQGKSVAAQVIAQAVSKMATGHQSVYSFPPDSKYFDGYTGQYAMIMDDLGQNPDGEDFKVFCQMVSTTHFVPNMASLDQKGTSFQTQVIIVTTNQTNFRPVTIADPGAIARRITFEYSVEPDGCIQTDGKLDLAQSLEQTGEIGPPFQFDCPLLTHLKFREQGKGSKVLPEVVDEILGVLLHKKTQANRLNMLVSQGLALKVADPVLEQTLENLNKYIGELEQHRDSVLAARRDFDVLCKVILGFITAIAGVWAVKKFLCNGDEKGDTMVVTPKAVVVDNGSQGSYDGKAVKKPKKELQILSLENGNPQLDFEIYCATKMVYQIQFRDGTTVESQSAIAIKERVFVVNAHTMKADWDSFTLVRPEGSLSFKRDEGYDVVEIHKKGASTDLAFVRLHAGPLFKDNVSKFSEGLPKKNLEVTGVAHFCEVPLLFEGTVVTDVSSMNTTTGVYNNCFRYVAKTRKGYCGAAVVGLEGNAKRVFGMHAAGSEGIAGACCLQRSMIQKVLKQLGVDTKLESQGLMIEKEPGPFVHVSRRTQLRPTCAKETFNPQFGPAALSKNDKRLLPGVDLDQKIFSKHVQNVCKMPAVMSDMAREYANQIFTQLGRDNGPITVQEAILGMDGLDAMEKKTSPGLPYTLQNKRREDLIDFETGSIKDRGLINEIASYQLGNYESHVFQTFLKDEIRPLEKVREGKTRIVDVASVGHCIVGRTLLGRFASKFQTHPGFKIGSAIGCNPDVDWTRFYHDAMRRKYVYDVDYSNFDASHGTAVFDVIKQEIFNSANGFDPRVWNFLDSLAESNHAYESRRFKLVGGLPSGCSSTSVINTVINNVVIRTGLAMVYQNFDFYDVEILAYGDDLLIATDFELDLNLLKSRLETIGYKITPANKGQAFKSVMQIGEAQFLKRKFVIDEGRPFLIRPVMEKENLAAMLSFYRPGTMTERLESIVQLAVHSGKEVYDWLFKPYRDSGFLIPEWSTANRRWYANFE